MLDQLLDRLHKVKPAGKNKWTACCPVHKDRSPSMSIKDDGDLVLIHCHACQADGLEVVKALGLPTKVLFHGATVSGRVPNAVMDMAQTAVFYCDLYEQEVARGTKMTLKEKREYKRSLQLRRTYEANKGRGAGSIVGNGETAGRIPEAFR